MINLYLLKLIDSGLFLLLWTKWILNKAQSEQFNKPLFLGGSHKETDAMWRYVLAWSLGWLVLKGCWQLHFFPCKPRNKDRKLWKCCYCISWHRYICIHITPFLQFEVLWPGTVMVCFRSRKFQNILSHSWSRQSFRFGLSWLTSKVGIKSRAFREETDCYQLLYAFGRDTSRDEMIADDAKFLV